VRLRPGLATALQEARAANCSLIVSRLDRLSRNVHFIAGLMEFKVHFVVAAFGQDVDNFTLHIYASIAQQERKMIGERISAAHLIAKNAERNSDWNCDRKLSDGASLRWAELQRPDKR
jgi:DNA invertase Pin-like site-specific DNA recombinase